MEGVIHRDLKPQNIMVGKHGKISVMDFGIARRMELGGGMTQTGALVGTPEYMSPEQAKGEKLDSRTDLFALGIIFYELLTGDSPYKAETAMATLYKRTKEIRSSSGRTRSTIPRAPERHCGSLPANRQRKALCKRNRNFAGLGNFSRNASWNCGCPANRLVARSAAIARHGNWIAISVFVVLLGFASVWYAVKSGFRRVDKPAPSGPSISLAILPFANGSGDPSLDWLGPSLADMLSTDVGQSSHLRSVSPGSCPPNHARSANLV